MSGENPRVCNQGILNYLLIVLRRDKNFEKFWKALKLIIKQPELRRIIEQVHEGNIHIALLVAIHIYVIASMLTS